MLKTSKFYVEIQELQKYHVIIDEKISIFINFWGSKNKKV